MLRRAQGIEPTPEEAAEEQRLARLNAEVKRHLTTILLEVTDGVFGARPCTAGGLACGWRCHCSVKSVCMSMHARA